MNLTIPPWVHQHLFLIFVGLWFASNVAGSLPSPSPTSGPFYKFVFALFQGTFGAIPRLIVTLMPGSWAAQVFTKNNQAKQE